MNEHQQDQVDSKQPQQVTGGRTRAWKTNSILHKSPSELAIETKPHEPNAIELKTSLLEQRKAS